jgi:predicted PurR-regulated permease PerM
MTYPEFIRRTISFVMIVIAAVLLVLLVGRIYPILVIGLLSWIIAVGLGIPINFFRRKGMQRGPAMLLTFVISTVVIALFIRLLLPALVTQVNNLLSELPEAGERAIESYGNLRASSEALTGLLPEFTVEEYRSLLEAPTDVPALNFNSVVGSALPLIANFGGFVASIALNLFLIFFLTLYFLLDPMVYYRIVIALAPAGSEVRVLEVLEQVRKSVVAWVGSMVLEVTITAIMVTIALGILRIPNAIALGVLAGLGNIVPYVGYWAALIPIVIFAAAVGGPGLALVAFIVYFVIGIVEANIILPANMGSSLKLPAAVILLFQGIAGTILGFWGVLLAVPLLAIVATLLREVVIFDALGKRSGIPQVTETPTGELMLDVPPPAPPVDEPEQEMTLTENTADPDEQGAPKG